MPPLCQCFQRRSCLELVPRCCCRVGFRKAAQGSRGSECCHLVTGLTLRKMTKMQRAKRRSKRRFRLMLRAFTTNTAHFLLPTGRTAVTSVVWISDASLNPSAPKRPKAVKREISDAFCHCQVKKAGSPMVEPGQSAVSALPAREPD